MNPVTQNILKKNAVRGIGQFGAVMEKMLLTIRLIFLSVNKRMQKVTLFVQFIYIPEWLI